MGKGQVELLLSTVFVPSWVAALPLWQWYAIPSTALSSVEPSPVPAGWTGPRSKIDAWNGAALKRTGSVYFVALAGGHADYAGNEVDALALNVEEPRWVQLRGPSSPNDMVNIVQFYLDKRGAATHTYYASQFIDSLNRLMVFPSPGMALPGLPAASPTWYPGEARAPSFDLAVNDWDHPDYVASWPGRGDFTACLVCKHPVTGDVYYSRNYGDGWWCWRQMTNSWEKLSDQGRNPWYAGSAVDPIRNRILVVGGYAAGQDAEVRDLNGTWLNGFALPFSAPTGLPGLVYDEAADCFLAFDNTDPITVYRVNAETFTVDRPAISGQIAQRPNGIMNSVQYVPELRGVVIANSYAGNVWFMRTA